MKKLDCFYKGQRKYIHGPDIYNSMYDIFREEFSEIPDASKLNFRKLANNQLAFSTTKITEKSVYSIFEASIGSKSIKYYLYETTDKINTRIEYDESDIIKNAKISLSSKEGSIAGYDRYTVSEISVALLKELCNKIISHSVKWIFVEINFMNSVPLYSKENIKVALIKNIGTKMVVSTISLNGKKIGNLKFSSK